MRTFCVAVACIAAVAGASNFRANAGGTELNPFASKSDLGERRYPSALQEEEALLGNRLGRPMARQNAVRLAQVGPSTAPVELFSGNPSQAPYKWVGLL